MFNIVLYFIGQSLLAQSPTTEVELTQEEMEIIENIEFFMMYEKLEQDMEKQEKQKTQEVSVKTETSSSEEQP